VESFISTDEFIGKAEARHEAGLLDPIDGTEGGGEEDAFDNGKRDDTFSESGTFRIAPAPRSVCLLMNCWQGVDSIK
jgi:hypothetical protein